MNNETLAPIFLDDKPITLKDPKPQVSAVLTAAGQAKSTDVRWMQGRGSANGTLLRPEHTLDRTSDPTKPIYLTSQGRDATKQSAGPKDTLVDVEGQKAAGAGDASRQAMGPRPADAYGKDSKAGQGKAGAMDAPGSGRDEPGKPKQFGANRDAARPGPNWNQAGTDESDEDSEAPAGAETRQGQSRDE